MSFIRYLIFIPMKKFEDAKDALSSPIVKDIILLDSPGL
jgi:hypothetical protein